MKTRELIEGLKRQVSHQGFTDNDNNLVFPDCVLPRKEVREIIKRLKEFEELKEAFARNIGWL